MNNPAVCLGVIRKSGLIPRRAFGPRAAPRRLIRVIFEGTSGNCAGDSVTILDHVFGVCVLAFGEHVTVCTFIKAGRPLRRALSVYAFMRTNLSRPKGAMRFATQTAHGRVMCKLHIRPCSRHRRERAICVRKPR